ncbi:hypothetical protein Dimus_007018 [Dionaea muscipula]
MEPTPPPNSPSTDTPPPPPPLQPQPQSQPPQGSQPQAPPGSQPQPPPTSSLPAPTSVPAIAPSPSPTTAANPNPNPNPKPATTSLPQQPSQSLPHSQPQPQPSFQTTQSRAPLNRPWAQSTHFQHFQSPHPQPVPSPSPVPSTSSSAVVSAPQRGGIAMGFPAGIPPSSTPMQPASLPASFSSPFNNQYGGVARNPVTVADAVSGSSPSPARPTILGLQSAGIMGSQIRPGAVPAHVQQRPVQSTSRPQVVSNNQPPPQNFQGQGLLRPSSVGPSSTSSPSTSQGHQSQHQPWLTSPHGRPPLPPPSSRTQMNPQSSQQRLHHVQQSHNASVATSQQQHAVSSQQQLHVVSSQQQQQPFTPSNPSQEHYGHNTISSRVSQSLPNQQLSRVQGLGNQKSPTPTMVQPGVVQVSSGERTAVVEADDSGNRILSKRSIQELVNQIDPSEHLDPEVEDILLDIAEEFVDSITTFGCSLAKHRKSSTLEAKDILLHLERNWNMTLPGFSGDEIKTYRKPLASDAHRERLAVVRKSMAGPEAGNTKSSAGQGAGNVKAHPSKAPPSATGS